MDNYNDQQNNQNQQQYPPQYGQSFIPQKNSPAQPCGETIPQITQDYSQQSYNQPSYQNGFMPPLSPEEEEYKMAATVSLVLGIISIVLSLLCCTALVPVFALIPAIVSLVFAHKSSKSKRGYSEATIGRVLSIISIVFIVIITALIIEGIASGEFNEMLKEFEDTLNSEIY